MFNNRPVLIVSGSMEPTITTGALTLVHFCTVSECEEGDIITYFSPDFNEYVTHRVVSVGDDYLVTRGDANKVDDPTPVIDGMMYGKVVAIWNFLAPMFQNFIKDRALDRGAMLGAILTVIVTIGLVLYFSLTALSVLCVVWEIKSGKVDSVSEEESVAHASSAIELVKTGAGLNLYQRLRLYIAYSRMAKSAEDVSALLHRYYKE